MNQHMKKSILITACIALLAMVNAYAQKADTLRAKATYTFTHIQDTNQRDTSYTEQMVLLLGRNASVYLSLEKVLQDEKMKKQIEEQIKNSAPGKMSININKTGERKVNAQEIFQFAEEKKLITKLRLVNNYLIEEPLPAIDWNISNETSTISGLNCQKATAHFKGRDYIAWFSQDLPFQAGPWKLNGLPGLIVEAYDTKKEVIFKFEGFEEVKNAAPVETDEKQIGGNIIKLGGIGSSDMLKSQTITLPKDGIKATQKEYDKLSEAMKKDPSGFINSSFAGSGTMVKSVQRSNLPPADPNKKVTVLNNPIELPERK
ncbi:GLPGLI family protein [Pedobacter metabolipauper]|uniref:GLPGLI family protein n=2 Tax=Pedobacter metabolipauper TaxID=425513 RepID=A0A4R6SRD7_9SPHI|nr:GLPGLI family protein [Pedobacter metabolipauper]